MAFQYIAIEGPIGVGKTSLAQRLASRLDATTVLEETDNPFLSDFYLRKPGAALQTQLFYLLNRHRQQLDLRQGNLFLQSVVADYLFDRDKIFAYLNLDDNELFIYQRLYDLLAKDVASPDLVVYLQAPTDVLIRRHRERRREDEERPRIGHEYLRELNEAYHHYFFHYTATPLLVVETSQIDWEERREAVPGDWEERREAVPGNWEERREAVPGREGGRGALPGSREMRDDALDDLIRQIHGMGRGTRYYVPRK